MSRGLASWHAVCELCKYEAADLQPAINDRVLHAQVDESDREIGLKAVRIANFRTILSLIRAKNPPSPRSLLDVGAAHGWFLEEASSSYGVLGVEPDEYVAQQTLQRGLPIRVGYFPGVLRAGEKFDVIVFNDVIEHIPDMSTVLDACYEHLADDGQLVLNLPSSDGLFYRIATALAKLGVDGPFERLWQKGLPSPHVHYFNKVNLAKTVAAHGFTQSVNSSLPSIVASGLTERIRAGGTTGGALYLQYLGALLILPWTKILPSDIMVSIFEKTAARDSQPPVMR